MDAFEAIIDHVLEYEGGYVNDPQDPGGETKFGISKRAHPNEDIKNLTVERAKEIYREEYFDGIRLGELHPQVAMIMFDCAVNQGKSRAIKILQECCHSEVDGIIGPNTIARANNSNPVTLVIDIAAQRAIHYSSLQIFNRYGFGWMRRLMSCVYAIARHHE